MTYDLSTVVNNDKWKFNIQTLLSLHMKNMIFVLPALIWRVKMFLLSAFNHFPLHSRSYKWNESITEIIKLFNLFQPLSPHKSLECWASECRRERTACFHSYWPKLCVASRLSDWSDFPHFLYHPISHFQSHTIMSMQPVSVIGSFLNWPSCLYLLVFLCIFLLFNGFSAAATADNVLAVTA